MVDIRYTAASLATPAQVRFQYKLRGRDREWVNAGTDRSVHYHLNAPGAFHFRVRAANGDGNWGPAATALHLVIEPFIWQTRWFPGVMIVLGAALVGGGGAWIQKIQSRRQLARLALQRERERERERISRDLHDHLGASLTGVGMLAADGVDTAPSGDASASLFRTIHGQVQTMVYELDALVWAVDPRKDTLAEVAGYLSSFVSEFAATSGLNARLDVPRGLPAWPVSSEIRHHLFLALKEAANNAVRHARATCLTFHLVLRGSELEVTLTDDGGGFDAAAVRPGNGLANLRERLAGLGGRAEVLSRPGHGTVVRLVLTLNESESESA